MGFVELFLEGQDPGFGDSIGNKLGNTVGAANGRYDTDVVACTCGAIRPHIAVEEGLLGRNCQPGVTDIRARGVVLFAILITFNSTI